MTILKRLTVAGLAVLFPHFGFAQETAPTQDAEPAVNANVAHLRIWSMLAAKTPARIGGDPPQLAENLSLVCSDSDGAPQVLAKRLRPFQTSGYSEYTPATRKIQLVRQNGSSLQELAQVKANLKSGMFLTLVVQKENGHYSLSLLDDTPKPAEQKPGEPPQPPSKQIILYDFLPGDPIPVSSKDARFSQTVSFESPRVVTGLPAKVFEIQIPLKVKTLTFLNTIEVDLQTYDSVSVLIVQNLYGRPAVTVLPNGKLD